LVPAAAKAVWRLFIESTLHQKQSSFHSFSQVMEKDVSES